MAYMGKNKYIGRVVCFTDEYDIDVDDLMDDPRWDGKRVY
jgi:hypothetical protein